MERRAQLWVASAVLLFASCEGPAGTAGPPGPPGAALGGSSLANCTQPCHSFTGIVDQYHTSTHFAVYVRNLGTAEVTTWTAPGAPCGKCHAIDAHQQRSKGNLTTPGGKVANLDKGEMDYFSSTSNKLAEAGYAGAAKVAQVYCPTCHQITSDPHLTGQPYASGTFAFWVPTGSGDEVYIEKSPQPGTVIGQPAGKFGTGNVCAWCHKARPDVTNYISSTAQTALASPFWGPHDGPQTDLYSGKGGYQFGGKTYTASHRHQTIDNGCVGCHMPDVPENKGYPNHSFYAQLSVCVTCHSGAKSFDVNGHQTEVQKGLSELEAALNGAGYLTRGVAAPDNSQPLSTAQLADNQFDSDFVLTTTPPKTVGADVAGAIWNYLVVARDRARGVHQPIYSEQLLWDSIEVVKGAQPSFIAARP